ncbi:growth arrest and DNA damage-inducible proteins-interacting protein 1 [Drosophila busckii]|uniref:growth arrest and DNA damage-inducible proteins-interacting protein 1 n=1 Tax=Drosophila busckii TaxID=30019 RepID=UPI00083ECC53|nr:growth arrest and DNA damage-inducible proteins-interacting protein 1 [Drosophila busckii]
MILKKLNVGTRAIAAQLKYSTEAAQTEPPVFLEDSAENVISCDKSGLRPQHKNVLYNRRPYEEPNSWIHMTEKYQRQMYGRYGAEAQVNPRICFGTAADKAKAQKFQTITQHETLLQMMEKAAINKAAQLQAVKEREDSIQKKLEKLEQWKADLNAKVQKRKADAAAAIERKERLIEEVRRHFGFKVDTRDERFKELLEQKEKEDKRKQKEAKRKVKEEKMMAKLVKQSDA